MSEKRKAPKGQFRVIALIKALSKDTESFQEDCASFEEAKKLADQRRKIFGEKIVEFFVYNDKGERVYNV